MKFIETELSGAYIIELEPFMDFRGSFARTFCAREFRKYGLKENMVQSNLSISTLKNTIRGMHFQIEGAQEAKLVRCIRGRILDVIIDIRKETSTFGKHISIELTETCGSMLYIPEGFAHGFLTLENECHVFYQVSNYYTPEKEFGIRWDDKFFGIKWSVDNPIVSEKDSNYPDFNPESFNK